MSSEGGLPVTTVVGLGNALMADDAFGPYLKNLRQGRTA